MAQEEDLRIKDLPNTKYKGFMMLDEEDGSGKMDVDTIFNNFAGKFVSSTEPSPTTTIAGLVYMHDGSLYMAKENGYQGSWDASKFTEVSISRLINSASNSSWTQGYFASSENGELVQGQNYEVSDFIAIPETGLLVSSYQNASARICIYDSAKNFLGSIGSNSVSNELYAGICYRLSFVGAAYIRVSNYTTFKDRGVWQSFSSLSTGFAAPFLTTQPYSAGQTVETENGLFRFKADHSAGAWNADEANPTIPADEIARIDTKWISGYFLSAPSGAAVSNASYEISDYIAVPDCGLVVLTHLFSSSSVVVYDGVKEIMAVIAGSSAQNEQVEIQVSEANYPGACFVRVTNLKREKRRFVKRLNSSYKSSSCKNLYKAFVVTKDYPAGTTVYNGDSLFRFKVDHSAGAWNAGEVVNTTVGEELNRLDAGWVQGYFINNYGTLTAQSSYEVSDYIVIPLSGVYVVTQLFTNTNISVYDKHKNFLGCIAGTEATNQFVYKTITRDVFEGAVYIRIDNLKSNKVRGAWVVNEYVELTPGQQSYCKYQGREAASFKKGLAIGDSLTSGTFNYDLSQGTYVFENAAYSWPTNFKKLSGVDMTNEGIGGSTPESWYSARASRDLSGHDFAVIALGVNCAFHDHGGWTSDSDEALKNIITKLETENPGIKIFVCTTFKSTGYTGEIFDEISEGIRESVADIQTTDDNVYLVDHHEYGTTGLTRYWHGHATATGYERIAEDLFRYISYIMSQDMDEFKYIQFIGTEYEP